MKKFILIFISVLLFISIFAPINIYAQRTAECDSCGYCKDRTPPENWNTCAQCLYPALVDKNTQPESNKTLEIDINQSSTNFNKPPKPAAGKYYTQLGCLNTGLNSFRDASAAGGVLNFILTTLIFPIVGTLAFGTIVYGAFLLATAQGDQFKIQQGRRMITSSVVGLIFTFGVVFIINMIGGSILKIPGMESNTVIGDLQKVKAKLEILSATTGQLPGHLDAAKCIHNEEISLDDPRAGIIATDGNFPKWDGPYLTRNEVLDPHGKPFYFDPDYYCRPDVSGCETLTYSPSTHDGISEKKVVRAIVYLGPDGEENYCLNGRSQCPTDAHRRDRDNIVLKLCP